MSTQLQQEPVALEYGSVDGAASRRRRRAFLFLSLAVAGVAFAMSLQGSLNANFVAQTMDLDGGQQGLLEAARETCGILALGVLAILAGVAEPVVGAAMLALLAVGISGYAVVPDFTWLVVASLVWSQGLHVWMPLPGSMALALAEPGRTGRRMGQLGSAGAIGAGAGLGLGMVLTWADVPIRPLYYLAGGAALLAAGACLLIPRNIKTPGPRLVIRRQYWVYYLLSFLDGWRKQIFIAFAGYMLVRNYGTPLKVMLVLAMVYQVLNLLGAPLVGRLIDRVGERAVLMGYFAALVPVCLGYALVSDIRALYVLLVLDNALFVCAMAQTTYVNRIAPPSEHTATLSMGVAVNHVASVAMPLVGGWLWNTWGSQWVFLVGAATAAVSILAAALVPSRNSVERQTEAVAVHG